MVSSDYWLYKTAGWRMNVCAGVGTFIMAGGIAGAIMLPKSNEKTVIVGAGLLGGLSAVYCRKSAREMAFVEQDVSDVSDQVRTNQMYRGMMQELPVPSAPAYSLVVAPEELPETLRLFDWLDLKNRRDDYPHLIILGKTGGGKSVLAEYLCGLLGGKVIAVAPHWELGDYPSADIIVGQGRNFGTSAHCPDETSEAKKLPTEPLVKFNDIVVGKVKPTICQFIVSLLVEMSRRYQVDPLTQKRVGGEMVNVILDEYNAFSSLPGVNVAIKLLIREARKVNIRIVLLCQGAEVKALGIEGEGSLRESLTFIRLKQFALDYAKVQLNKQPRNSNDYQLWTNYLNFLGSQERPCMVDDVIARIPDLSSYRVTPTYHQPQVSNGLNQNLPNAYQNAHPVDTEGFQAFNPTYHNTSEVPKNAGFDPKPSNHGKQGKQGKYDEPIDDLEQYFEPEVMDDLIARAKKARAEGISPSVIVQKVWGFKTKTKPYQMGKQLWICLMDDEPQ